MKILKESVELNWTLTLTLILILTTSSIEFKFKLKKYLVYKNKIFF